MQPLRRPAASATPDPTARDAALSPASGPAAFSLEGLALVLSAPCPQAADDAIRELEQWMPEVRAQVKQIEAMAAEAKISRHDHTWPLLTLRCHRLFDKLLAAAKDEAGVVAVLEDLARENMSTKTWVHYGHLLAICQSRLSRRVGNRPRLRILRDLLGQADASVGRLGTAWALVAAGIDDVHRGLCVLSGVIADNVLTQLPPKVRAERLKCDVETVEQYVGRLREQLRSYIARSGYTHEALRLKLGWARGQISRLLNVNQSVPLEKVLLLLEAIGADPRRFWFEFFSRR